MPENIPPPISAYVNTLARSYAKQRMKEEIRRCGRRWGEFDLPEISLMARAYLDANRAELLGLAAVALAVGPAFQPTTRRRDSSIAYE